MSAERMAKLSVSLEASLPVAGPINIEYLTGLVSSNAALLTGPEATTLIADASLKQRGRTCIRFGNDQSRTLRQGPAEGGHPA